MPFNSTAGSQVRDSQRAPAPSSDRQRSRLSAFAGRHRGHSFSHCPLRRGPSSSVARQSRYPSAPFHPPSPQRLCSSVAHEPNCLRCRLHRAPLSSRPLSVAAVPSLWQAAHIVPPFTTVVHQALPPNRSVNRTANGMAPWPCNRLGSSSAARPRHHAAVGRLPLR